MSILDSAHLLEKVYTGNELGLRQIGLQLVKIERAEVIKLYADAAVLKAALQNRIRQKPNRGFAELKVIVLVPDPGFILNGVFLNDTAIITGSASSGRRAMARRLRRDFCVSI